MFRPFYDDDGKTCSGLYGDYSPLNDFDDIDKPTAWDKTTSHSDRDDKYTGEATIDRELQQKQFNSAFNFAI